MPNKQLVESILEVYADQFSHVQVLSLLKVMAFPEQGGMGYRIETFNPTIDMDGWEIDHEKKIIMLDISGLFSSYTVREMAVALKESIETEFIRSRASLLSRIGWGTGKVIIGVVETTIGLVGIVVPEPGTTAAGVGMVVLGTNTLGDGVSQLSGANQGQGYNLLGRAFASAGATVADLAGYDPVVGDQIGRGVFLVSSVAFGSIGSIKILNIKSISSIRLGVGGQPGGMEVGRVAMGYASNRTKDGMTIININNNSGQWILRFVTHGGKLVVNGRVVGVSRVLKHEGNWRVVAKGLLKLLAHGAKRGL